MYNEIQAVAFRFASGVEQLTSTFYELDFPPKWHEALLSVYSQAKKRALKDTSLPIRDLNSTVRALVPDVISIDRQGKKTWLRSRVQAATPEALQLLLYWWAHYAMSDVDDSLLKPVLNQLRAEDLVWQQRQLDLIGWKQRPNGTADLDGDSHFHIIPDYIASKLSAPNAVFELQGQRLSFMRVPLSPGMQGAELMSWPPLPAIKGKQKDYFSILITVTLQTVPYQSYPVVHVELGRRRWVSQPNSKLGGGRKSVYLRQEVAWIEGVSQFNSFQVAQIRWAKTEEGFSLIWDGHLVDILSRLSAQTMPSPQTLVNDPIAVMNPQGMPNMALVYSNAIKPNHIAGVGMMPEERSVLVKQIAEQLSPELELIPPFSRIKAGRSVKVSKPSDSEETFEHRHYQIAQRVGRQLCFEIHYQKTDTRDALLAEIRAWLGLSMPAPQNLPMSFQLTEHLSVEVHARLLGAIGDALQSDGSISSKTDRTRRAINARASQIQQVLPTTLIPTFAFVELNNKDKFAADEDPKRAIRMGFAKAGRLTQFIDADSSANNLSERAKKAFHDGLRQLGVSRVVSKGAMLSEEYNYVGLWKIFIPKKQNIAEEYQNIPAFVMFSPTTKDVRVRIHGIDEWLPYREALLRIGKDDAVKGFTRRESMMPFVQQVLRNEILPEGNAVLIVHAQNFRQMWHWLSDKHISIDSIAFGKEEPRSASDFSGLRVVRVRDNDQHETPEWYAIKPSDVGLAVGLFAISERVFASTYGKAAQFKNISKTVSVLKRPTSTSWNPGLFELTVAIQQHGDVAHQVAFAVHVLRKMAIQYDDATALPLPLHLVKQIQEYILSVNYDEDADDD